MTRDRKALDVRVERRRASSSSTPAASTSRPTTRCRARSSARRARRSPRPTRSCSSSTRAPGCGAGDAELAAILRGADVPVLVVANKVDRPADEPLAAELHGLGLGEPLRRLGDPRPRHRRPARPRGRDRGGGSGSPEAEEDAVRLAIIGRPNVGKSSLVNRFLGAERVIVSERAGTTRDAIDTELEFDGRRVVLVDTAGPAPPQPRSPGTVDYYAQLRSERAAERADVAIVVCDASEGVTSEDLRIAELAMRSGCATIVALNKWDVAETDLDDARARARAAAAAAAAGVDHLGEDRPRDRAAAARGDRARRPARRAHPDARAQPLHRRRRRATPAARRSAASACASTTPPRSGRARRASRSRSTTGGLISRDWAYHLENRLRERYELRGRAADDRLRAPQPPRRAQAAVGPPRGQRGRNVNMAANRDPATRLGDSGITRRRGRASLSANRIRARAGACGALRYRAADAAHRRCWRGRRRRSDRKARARSLGRALRRRPAAASRSAAGRSLATSALIVLVRGPGAALPVSRAPATLPARRRRRGDRPRRRARLRPRQRRPRHRAVRARRRRSPAALPTLDRAARIACSPGRPGRGSTSGATCGRGSAARSPSP